METQAWETCLDLTTGLKGKYCFSYKVKKRNVGFPLSSFVHQGFHLRKPIPLLAQGPYQFQSQTFSSPPKIRASMGSSELSVYASRSIQAQPLLGKPVIRRFRSKNQCTLFCILPLSHAHKSSVLLKQLQNAGSSSCRFPI